MPDQVQRQVARALADAGLRADLAAERISRAVEDEALAAGVEPGQWTAEEGARLVGRVVERLTTQESWFFREPQPLRAAVEQAPAGRSVQVWCAGCANGQEAWTAAMLLHERREEWHVTATDLSAQAVARAADGVYRTGELRGLTPALRARHLTPAPDEGRWAIGPHLRGRVTFLRHNAARQAPPVSAGSCHIVLCRNVLIYLADDAVQTALTSFERALAPDGVLVLGAAESLWGLTDAFEPVRLGGRYAYRKRGQGPPHPTRPARSRLRPVGQELPDAADLVSQARAAAERGDHAEAARVFRQAAYLDPDRPDAHDGLSEALDALGQSGAAARAKAAARAAGRRRARGGR
ncbi:MAG TPA: CheR family methyltransferase [Acidimicrobiales bacterium]|nr:CheR family methyltransferase [Acidimicrobiales bacterium]